MEMSKVRIILLFLIVAFASQWANAQYDSIETIRKNDMFLYELHTSGLLEQNGEMQFSQSITNSFQLLYDLAIKESSWGLGFGIGTTNKRFKGMPSEWNGLDNCDFCPYSLSLANSSIVTRYLDMPLEIRFIQRKDFRKTKTGVVSLSLKNNVWRFGIGVRPGYLYSKKLINDIGSDSEQKHRLFTGLLPYKVDVTTRFGYGRVNASASYSLLPLFDNPNDTKVPLSLGISFVIF